MDLSKTAQDPVQDVFSPCQWKGSPGPHDRLTDLMEPLVGCFGAADVVVVNIHAKAVSRRCRPGTLDDSTLLSVRVLPALLDRLDEQLEAMQRDLPGVSLSRADVVQLVLEQALRG